MHVDCKCFDTYRFFLDHDHSEEQISAQEEPGFPPPNRADVPQSQLETEYLKTNRMNDAPAEDQDEQPVSRR